MENILHHVDAVPGVMTVGPLGLRDKVISKLYGLLKHTPHRVYGDVGGASIGRLQFFFQNIFARKAE